MMRRRADCLLTACAWAASLGALALVACVVGFLAWRGVRALEPGILFGEATWWRAVLGLDRAMGGLWPAVVGTTAVVVGSCAMAVPLGVLSGLYLAEYASRRWGRAFSSLVDVLAAVPSIIMGLFGFGLILLLRRTLLPKANTCLLLSMACVALLVLPYLIRATESALRGLPEGLRLVGPSLGLSPWQSIQKVLLPAASRGITSGVILAVGRAAEDTAVILLTGVVASAGIPAGLTGKFEALPFKIYYLSAQHRSAAELDMAFAAAAVLLCITGAIFAAAWWLHARLGKRWRAHP